MEQLLERGCMWEEAKEKVEEEEKHMLNKLLENIQYSLRTCKFPPQAYLALTDEETADCTSLMKCTANVLTDEGLQKLLISTQQANIMLNVEYAVRR
ncbi:hypothetical protein ID866_7758 [Astraeus odoratus]|nr:hypothetical protein ID866_7758 [Astraeus odoratus]